MELKRLDHYEPGTKLIALFPVKIYKSLGPVEASARGTKVSAGEVVTVYGDGPESGGLRVRWAGSHYLVYARSDFAVAPEPHQIAWMMVDNNICRGRIDRLQAHADGLVTDLGKARERIKILEQELVEADNERRRQENAAQANRQIGKVELGNLQIALDYLRRIGQLSREVDEVFNLSEQDFPGQTE